MDAVLARKMWRTLEPYHSFVYFAPAAQHLDYFALRAAALGPVPAQVVAATFFNFNPELVRRSIPASWSQASPVQWIEQRLKVVDTTLRGLLGDAATSDDAVEAAALARRATLGCRPEGRPLYAGHASLPWPSDDEPHLVLWHAVTLLREFRGDGHIAALVTEGLDGCQSLVLHAASGEVSRPILQGTRGWTDMDWATAVGWLRERGWVDADGGMTEAGQAARERYEELTDRLAMAPWDALGTEDSDRLRALVRPFSWALVEAGLLSFR